MHLSAKLLAVILLVTSSTVWAHSGATGIVKERMDNFEASKASMKRLKKAVKHNDFVIVAKEAESINHWALKLIKHFPSGSNSAPSEALDLIWEEFDRFELKAMEQIEASDRLREAGLAGDAKGAASAFSALAKSCKACHDDYRK